MSYEVGADGKREALAHRIFIGARLDDRARLGVARQLEIGELDMMGSTIATFEMA